jgi:SagB-type dehydrogenase family enzyme
VLRDLVAVTVGIGLLAACGTDTVATPTSTLEALPTPRLDGPMSLEDALATRRSVRAFADAPVARTQLGQLLWSAQGVTSAEGRRTAPSAGALYPLEVYVADASGLYRYVPASHALERLGDADLRDWLGEAAGQEAVGAAPTVVVITAVEARTAIRYGDRAARYVALEAGHAAQNLLLEATALGLGAVPIGSFDDRAVADVLRLPDGEAALYLIPVGESAP